MISLENFYQTLANNKDSYTLINNALSKQDHAKCLDIAKNLRPTEDEYYDSILFDPVKLLGEDHFFSKIDIQTLGKIYGLDNVDHYQWEIARDDPEFDNDFHTDVHFNKNTVTIQWYLDMDDITRKLHISKKGHIPFSDWETNSNVQELDTKANSMVAFLAKPNTYHGFKSGHGHRYNVRLRFIEYLKKDMTIHNVNDNNKICWFVDAKDMEVESYPIDDQGFWESEDGSIEEFLARYTYECLLSHKQSNIIVNDKIKQYPKTLQYLKDQGFEKCVIAMAGTCITEQTIDYVYNKTNDYPVYGQLYDEYQCFLRKVTILNLNEIDVSQADGFNNYLSAYISNFKEVNYQRDLGCLYVHPEHDTFRALFDMARFPTTASKKLDRVYPELSDRDRSIIKNMLEYYQTQVLAKFPIVDVDHIVL